MKNKVRRPCRCLLYGRQLYYYNEPKFEEEFAVITGASVEGYVHRRCIKAARAALHIRKQ